MKAAVLYQHEGFPQYADVPEPIVRNEDELPVRVKAVAIKHFDKSRAGGKHYSTKESKEPGRVIGGDGVCVLESGERIWSLGVSGMLAKKATIEKDRIVKVPDGIDDATAAALPNAVIGSAMALRFKADIKPGDVVLINGATGFTGRVAVQIAKHYGAKKVIATGRNPESLKELVALGADEIIPLSQPGEDFQTAIRKTHSGTPIDIIIDYLWGQSAEIILTCLKGDGSFTNRIRYVSVGSVTGDLIQLSAANLRSVNLQLTGSGLGAWSKEQVGQLFKEILPEMFQLAVTGKLQVKTVTVKLDQIGHLWNVEVPGGQRLVVCI